MEKESTAIRLKKIMSDRNLRQVDILELCKPYCQKFDVKLGRNDLSQYVSGKVEPGQKKLTILGLALNVNEAWLMGFNVPMERNDYEDQNIITFDAIYDTAINFLNESGFNVTLSDDGVSDVIIKNKQNDILACMHDYELVGRYLEICQREKFTARDLWEDTEFLNVLDRTYAFDYQLKALGWTYKIIFEADPINKGHGRAVAIFRNKDSSFRASMEDCDSFINDAESFFKKRLQQLFDKFNESKLKENSAITKTTLMPIAAHERTGIEVTDEMKKHDDDLMDDPDIWK